MEYNLYKDIFDNSTYGVFVTDLEGNFLEFNDKFCDVTGYSKSRLRDMNFEDLIPEDKKEASKKVVDMLVRTGFVNGERKYINGNSEIRYMYINTVRINGDRYLNYIYDTTKQKNLEKKIKQEKERAEKYFESANTIFVVLDKDGCVNDINKKGCEKLGHSKKDIIGENWFDNYIPQLNTEEVKNVFNKVIFGEIDNVENYENPIVNADGEEKIISWYNNTIRDESGEISFIISAGIDITEQIESEKTLIESENRFRVVFENSPIAKSITKISGELYVNKAFCEMTGYTKKELKGRKFHEITHPDDLEISNKAVNNLINGESDSTNFQKRYIKKDGSIIWAEVHVTLYRDEEGNPLYFITVINDITDRLLAERKLKESEARYRVLFDESGVGVGYFKQDGTIIALNKTALQDINKVDEDIAGKSIYDIHPKKFADKIIERINKTIKTGRQQTYESLVKLPDGQKWLSSTYCRVKDEDENVLGVIIAAIDITKIKIAEDKLKRSEQRYRKLVENSPVCTKILDKNFNLTYMSDAGVAMLKIDDVNEHYNRPYPFYFFPESFKSTMTEHIELSKTKKEVISLDGTACDINGEEVSLHSIIVPIIDEAGEIDYMMVVSVNTTKRMMAEKEKAVLESQIRKQQRLESIGTLASGVAHEINNPINGILNYGQIILDSEVDDNNIKEYAGEIIHETQRVSEIVKNLLEFSRQNKEQHSYANIEDIINKTLSLIKTVMRHDQVALSLDIEKDIPKIKCRSQQIQQVIMNLVTNAKDALNEKYPGYDENKKINISCTKYNSDGRKWIKIIIEDYGTGVPKDSIDSIFDPFFTTKRMSEGTGLGLSISYGIVKEHHGEMTVESEVGEYTRFIVNLPCDNGWELE